MTLTSVTGSDSPATLISHVVDRVSEVLVTVAWIQTDDSISSRRRLVAAGAAVRAAEAGAAMSPTTGAVRPWHATPRCCSSGTRLVDVAPETVGCQNRETICRTEEVPDMAGVTPMVLRSTECSPLCFCGWCWQAPSYSQTLIGMLSRQVCCAPGWHGTCDFVFARVRRRCSHNPV